MSNPVLTNAEAAVKQLQSWTDLPLDYSPESLEAVEDLLETASHQALNEQTQAALVELLGCYILEVGMREFGGKYAWSEERNQFVLVVGEPEFSVAIMTKGRVRGVSQVTSATISSSFTAASPPALRTPSQGRARCISDRPTGCASWLRRLA